MGTVPTPWTMGANGVIPSTSYNTGGRDVMAFLLRPPGCTAKLVNNLSIPDNTATRVTFDTQVFDTDGMYSEPSSNVITINTPGVYTISASVAFVANATGVRFATIVRNGSAAAGQYTVNIGGGTPTSLTASFTDLCAVGDTIQLEVYQNSGAALSIYGTGWTPARLSATWISNI